MSQLRSYLSRFQPSAMDSEQIKREGWNEQGILVVSMGDDRLDFVDREFIKRIGERLYGKKTG